MDTYESKFGNNGVIANLSKCGFHGKLIINFTDGVPQSSKVPHSNTSLCNATYVFSATEKFSGNGMKNL